MTNITFIIGNGFDINLGMKTQYANVYDGYIATPSSNDNIAAFKNSLKADRMCRYKLWSDFEMGMGEFAQSFESENAFIECVRDFKAYMVQHLRNEQARFTQQWKDDISFLRSYAKFFEDSVLGYSNNLIPNAKRAIEKAARLRPIHYSFITFNYTAILDYFIQYYNQSMYDPTLIYNFSDPIHLHGHLNGDVVVGVDNEQQINNGFELTMRGRRAFIKPKINQDYDQGRVDEAKKVISESNIICVYGLSLGQSDLTWTIALKEWLQQDNTHHLIYNYYDLTQYPQYHNDLLLEVEDSRKEEILGRMQFADSQIQSVFDQVHIPVGANMFDTRRIPWPTRRAQVASPPVGVR